jgi:DNA-binding transcriptional LysR family regulator
MNLQQLRYLAATVEHQTMTAAAAALHVSQPALSRAVRAMERELGVPLFARSGRGVVPTPAGLAVAGYARRVLGELDRLRQAVAGVPVTVVTTPTTGADLLPGLVRSWLARGERKSVVLRHMLSPLQVAVCVIT